MRKNGQISESFLLGAVLACVGGFLDAYTYICRGGVFANAQTGNIVFLGIRLAQGRPRACLKYLIPILAFVAGVVIAELVRHHFRDNTRLHWRQVIIAFEIVILAVVCFIPQRETCNLAANVLISFVCSLQVQGFRKMNGRTFSTTMCTGDLRSAAEFFCTAALHRCPEDLAYGLQYLGVILFFVLGAALGAVLTAAWGTHSMLVVCLGLAAAFALMFIGRCEDKCEDKEDSQEHS